MLVSVCCSASVMVEHTEDCAFYVCCKCKCPTDGRCSLLLEGRDDADIQSGITE